MSNLANPSFSAGLAPRFNSLPDAQFSSYVRKEAVSAKESLNAGLTIQTKEGDVVTLNSSSFASLDSFTYNSQGVLETEDGRAVVTQNYREVTLTTGERFSFSVEGDLSEAELADIEAIVTGIDEIISEVARGDMEDAVSKALSMGGYDTVSMYAADISHQKSYAMASEIQAQTLGHAGQAPVSPNQVLPDAETKIPRIKELLSENQVPAENNSVRNLEKFLEKMVEQLEKFEEKLAVRSQGPLDKLFNHHLEAAKENVKADSSAYDAIAALKQRFDQLMEDRAGSLFKDNFSAYLE